MHERICTICGDQAKPRNFKRGMCGACYQRWQYHGHVTSRPLKGMDLFWTRVEKTETCWNWSGATTSGGYGVFGNRGPNSAVQGEAMAHRIAYINAHGPIPDGLVLDHLCRNRCCVNPRHLEAVTEQVNILRGEAPSAANALKTHCDYGHPFDMERKGGRRGCSICHARHSRETRARQRQQSAA